MQPHYDDFDEVWNSRHNYDATWQKQFGKVRGPTDPFGNNGSLRS